MAKPAPKIVARNYTEAHAFARKVLKLSKGSYRVVTSPASLVGVAGEVYLAPGWNKRSDRYAMQNKLRFTRLTVKDYSNGDVPGEDQDDSSSNGDNMVSEGAPVFTIFSDPEAWLKATTESLQAPAEEDVQEIADAIEADPLPSLDEDNDVKEDDSDNDVEPEDERPLNGRRRRRCKYCGELIHPDDVEEHAAAEAAKKAALEEQ